jgi:hypothetical protein
MRPLPQSNQSRLPAHTPMPVMMRLLCCTILAFGLAACASTPPKQQDNLCQIFRQYPEWYDHTLAVQKRWGTPIHVQMAIVQQESSFRAGAKPERTKLLGLIPWRRPSSAKGYAQAQDPAWQDYLDATGRMFARRGDFADAVDFIGWYNNVSNKRLNLAKNDAYNLYLAYHEGHGGYSRGSWKGKSALQSIARKVERQAAQYQNQLNNCQEEFHCRRWYQVWPFCR